MKDYVKVVYDQNRRPLTSYPEKLTSYLVDRFSLEKSSKLLDLGCGRGEFAQGFSSAGMDVVGVDRSKEALLDNFKFEFVQADLEVDDKLPFSDNTFDVVYTKSVVEHFYYPEKIFTEFHRVLKPGGKLITLTPDWESIFKIFYEDFTHRTPFTLNSLKEIHLMNGFTDVEVEKFYQLPIIWKFNFFKCFSKLISLFVPQGHYLGSKFLRFSKEVMLLSFAIKPANEND
jgi:SAM-dependent methyltransferase